MNKRDFKKLKVGDIVYCLRNKRKCVGGYDINLCYPQKTKITELFTAVDDFHRTEYGPEIRKWMFSTEKEARSWAVKFQTRNINDMGKAARAMASHLFKILGKAKKR